MQFYIYELTDLGFEMLDGTSVPEITGLDNLPPQDGDDLDLRFRHRGTTGYPVGAVALFDYVDRSKTLAGFEDSEIAPEGGVTVVISEVIPMLVNECGWPDGSYLDDDGMPKSPAPSMAMNNNG